MADPTIILDIEPDWSVEPVIGYSFLNALQDTPYFKEQRRPLLPTPDRSLTYKFTERAEVLQRLRNTLIASSGSRICTPIFSEPIFAASIITGGSSITASTVLTYLWNINNCDYVVLIDTVTGQSEMLVVSSVSGQLIRFATNILKTWIAGSTVIYPAIASYMRSIKESGITNNVGSIDVSFDESTLGEDAVAVWVGLEDPVCLEGVVFSGVRFYLDVHNLDTDDAYLS